MKNYDSVASLQDELSSFLDDIVDLAKSKTGLDGERLEELKLGFRERLEGLGSDAESAARGAASNIADGAEDALSYVEDYVQANPWHVVLAAGVLGLALGALVSRR